MMRSTKFGFAAILGAAIVAAGQSPAVCADTPEAKDSVDKQIEKLRKAVEKLEQIETRLNDYDKAQDVRKIREEVTQVKDQVRALQTDIAAIRDLLKRPDGYTARRIDPAAQPTGRNGRIRLTNDYVTEMSVLINGVSHRLFPGQQAIVEVPPGPYAYQVLGVQPIPQNRVIMPEEIKDIRIHPPGQ